jgi:hypothetical protein
MMNNKELALLTNKLQAPMVVADILGKKTELTDEVYFGLHEMISDFNPDTALLAIAVSARKISHAYEEASAGMNVLVMECDRIISCYGPLWLENASGHATDEDEVLEALANAAEDLEGIAELLEVNGYFLRAKDSQAASLFEILAIQARAHTLIAEEFLIAADKKVETMTAALSAATPVINDNVIPFPARGTARA